MAGFDRSKFKAASMNAINEQQQHQEVLRPSNQFNNDVHEIKDGKNWFRIAPFHPEDGGQSPFEAKCVSFLEVSVPKKDENKKVIEGQFENRQKPVFNSRVHGGFEIDLVEEYMKVAKDTAIPAFAGEDKAVQNAIWKKITSFDVVKKKSGLKPQDTWQCYAWDRSGKLATLEIKKSVKDQLNELAASMSNDPTTPDPFSDPDDGIAIIITKSGTGLNTAYSVELDYKMEGKFNKQFVPTPLTELQLEQLMATKSLYKRFVNSFTHKDLKYQLEGLENFDKALAAERYGIGVFQYDEFLDSIDKMFTLVPETEEAQEEAEPQAEPAPVTTRVQRPAVAPKATVAPKAPVRAAVAPPKPTVNVPTRRSAPVAAQEQEVIDEPIEAEEEMATAPQPTSVNERLAGLRNRLGKK